MKFIIPAIFMALTATIAQAQETNPIYQSPDAQSKFREAQLHVQELMKTGRYAEASKFMSVYQTLACEAAEQKAGRSAEEGAAICARKNAPAGINAGQSSSQPAQAATESLLGPSVTVMQRTSPGSSTLLDSSAPSIFVFDPRNVPGADSRTSSRNDTRIDPWTGKP
ncbi:hypothetical protein EBAPG3_009945 [Nitrosospira lacus]|uniref:DUF4398 domain-containing protein n=1 Tax=Nitrosospira lacus TaxID=1288494 RepID=A0A1W6SQJ7_9PROT|nr:hypothetical protein [Nitrosospira lacus]ARO88066.1 hypothetical protein EBAPG3_009945 [Nitrosospira lacus]